MTDKGTPHIFMVAGEASGDLLGGRLMKAIRAKSPHVSFSGIGGTTMEAQGMKSLFPMENLSVMGLAEIVPKLSLLIGRYDETVKKIMRVRPDAVITIDAPDFSFRVGKKIKKSGYKGPIIHYVAPSVWAWRPKRAKRIAGFLDHLLCFLPFEPPWFEKYGLKTTYTGHSVLESALMQADGNDFRQAQHLPESAKIVLLLPGSRQSEIDRHLRMFLNTAEHLHAMHQDLVFVMPTLPHLKERIQAVAAEYPFQTITVTDEQEKYNAFAAGYFAIAASGTVALELALARVPTVVCYKMNWLTGLIARLLVKARFVSLPNLIVDEEIMPELLLEDATLENLVNVSDCYLSNEIFRDMQRKKFEEMLSRMAVPDGQSPSDKAADVILDAIMKV